MDLEIWQLGIIFLTGLTASFINSLAGGGSTVSMPILVLLGFSSHMAVGTNRFGLMLGALASLAGLKRKGFFDSKSLLPILPAMILGTILGSYLIFDISDEMYRKVLAVVIALVVAYSLTLGTRQSKKDGSASPLWVRLVFFFLAGAYAGSFQVGIGFVMMFIFSHFTGLDLVRVNALKAAMAAAFMSTSVIIFAYHGSVHWPAAIAFGIGGLGGGYLGSHVQVKKGEKWLKRMVSIIAIGLAIAMVLV